MKRRTSIAVGRETLRAGEGLRQAAAHPEVLLTSSQDAGFQCPVPVQLAGVTTSAKQLDV